jgi:hypothetical protein
LTAGRAGSVAAPVRVHVRRQRWLRSEDLGQRLIRALLVVDSTSTADANDPDHHVVHDNRHPARHQEEALRQSNQFLVDGAELVYRRVRRLLPPERCLRLQQRGLRIRGVLSIQSARGRNLTVRLSTNTHRSISGLGEINAALTILRSVIGNIVA